MRPNLADLEALAAEAEDLPGIVLEYEPLSKCVSSPFPHFLYQLCPWMHVHSLHLSCTTTSCLGI